MLRTQYLTDAIVDGGQYIVSALLPEAVFPPVSTTGNGRQAARLTSDELVSGRAA